MGHCLADSVQCGVSGSHAKGFSMSGRSCRDGGVLRWDGLSLAQGLASGRLARPAGDVLLGDDERMAWLWARPQPEAGQQSDWQALQRWADIV